MGGPMLGTIFSTSNGRGAPCVASLVLILGCGVAGAENEDTWDAAEIAARAVASALPDPTEVQEHSDLASEAYDAVVRDLLQKIESIEKEQGHVARALEVPLFELGKLYVTADHCQDAIPLLRQAIALTQRLDGVMNTRQLAMYEPLLHCLVAKDMIIDLQRALEQTLLIRQNTFGRNDVRIIPGLAYAGSWYERAGQYENARELYQRCVDIARKAGGDNDARLVGPLRSLARTFRLQVQYEPEPLRGRALDAAGERMLVRAVRIVRENAAVSPSLRIDTLLELADWYQMSGAVRDAQKIYKEVWSATVESGKAGESVLGEPTPLLYRAAVGIALRAPPPDRQKMKHYWIDFEFRVTRFGEVEDIVAKSSTAPSSLQLGIAENLKRTHYRPRFANGESVDTDGVKVRQGVWFSP
jgi:tetratricopeptide (TPR) repeat protein